MKRYSWLLLAAGFFLVAGCPNPGTEPPKGSGSDQPRSTGAAQPDAEAVIRDSLAKLSPEDRKLAEQQRFCAVEDHNRLGSMNTPVKIMLKDQPVFLCCAGCSRQAEKNPDETLAKVKELKAKNAPPAPAPEKKDAPEKASGKVGTLRVPGGGIQPQVMVDGKGVVHMIYYAGDAKAGDVFYVRAEDGEKFSKPLRVNSQPNSAIAAGNIRGAHIALGKGGRVHVAWMGAGKAEPKAPGNGAPMLYSRLNDAGTAFEDQRNVIQKAPGLDGGGSVAADEAGNVYVAWHAPEPGTRGEDNRCVWVTHSRDEGKTFAEEKRANKDATGACGCCGMRAFADRKGELFVLYRSASETVHRDMYVLTSTDKAASFRGEKLQEWNVGACPMSSMAFTEAAGATLAAWETDGQVSCARIDPTTGKASSPLAAPGNSRGRKHPVVAGNAAGETILVWTEGMGWDRGGSLASQVFDKDGKPTDRKGKADGVPKWSLVGVFARPDGSFTIVY